MQIVHVCIWFANSLVQIISQLEISVCLCFDMFSLHTALQKIHLTSNLKSKKNEPNSLSNWSWVSQSPILHSAQRTSGGPDMRHSWSWTSSWRTKSLSFERDLRPSVVIPQVAYTHAFCFKFVSFFCIRNFYTSQSICNNRKKHLGALAEKHNTKHATLWAGS